MFLFFLFAQVLWVGILASSCLMYRGKWRWLFISLPSSAISFVDNYSKIFLGVADSTGVGVSTLGGCSVFNTFGIFLPSAGTLQDGATFWAVSAVIISWYFFVVTLKMSFKRCNLLVVVLPNSSSSVGKFPCNYCVRSFAACKIASAGVFNGFVMYLYLTNIVSQFLTPLF